MSAVVCGKRTLFEELTVPSPNPVSKRIRCSSSSPVRFSPPRSHFASASSAAAASFIDQLSALFPDMDKKLLEKALEECGDNLDSAIRSLNELRLGSSAVTADVPLEANVHVQVTEAASADPSVTEDSASQTHLPVDGGGWVDLFVREMMNASNMDEARARCLRALEVLEKSISAHAGAEAAKSFHQENMMLKEQVEALMQENAILKRAVSIQHERQKEFEKGNQELQHLKQLVSQYQDQLRTLEVNNYALTMHLKQAQQSSSIPGRFHPDVF